MPYAPKKPCAEPGCPKLIDVGTTRCEKHKPKQRWKLSFKGTDPFYKSKRWLEKRAEHLIEEPLCRSCRAQGMYRNAHMVDHIVPRSQGGADLDDRNLQSLCNPCHQRKRGEEAHYKRPSLISSRRGTKGEQQ